MALFKKKTTTTEIPELQEYYATQKKDNTGLAWLLAFLSLVVTAAIIVGLFIGGRFIYRKISHKDTKSTTTTETAETNKSTGNTDTGKTTPNPELPTPTVAAPETSNGVSGAINTPSTTAPAQGVSPQQTPDTNSVAVAATSTIPDTGAGNTIVLFIAVTLLAYAARYQFVTRKN